MSTDPLSATTPLALFGVDALSDARALKRAYARLIRRYKPEVAPEAFAHIRRVYEVAKAALEAGADDPIAEQSAAGEGEGEAEGEAEMPEPLLDLIEIMQLDPEPGYVWGEVMAALLTTDAERVDQPALGAALDALPALPRLDALGAWIVGLSRVNPPRAVEMWRDIGPELARHPALYARTVVWGHVRLRWHLEPEELHALITYVESADSAVDEDEHPAVIARLFAALAWHEGRATGAPEPVLDAVQTGHGMASPDAARSPRSRPRASMCGGR